MSDQAENLRLKLMQRNNSQAKAVAIVSGKGGVGKSNFSLNFAISLAKLGKRVLLFDMDIGMGNIDILMGRNTEFTIIDFFEKQIPLKEIISTGPENISFLAGGSGLTDLFSLEESAFKRFLAELTHLTGQYDYILFDMGAGINQDSSKFLLCVDELIVITTPEPTAIMDAYSMMKYLNSINHLIPFYLICNRVETTKEGQDTNKRLQNALRKFLTKEITPLGLLPDDKTVSRAVIKQIPFILFNPEARVSKALIEIASRFIKQSFSDDLTVKNRNFLGNLKRYFLGKKAHK